MQVVVLSMNQRTRPLINYNCRFLLDVPVFAVADHHGQDPTSGVLSFEVRWYCLIQIQIQAQINGLPVVPEDVSGVRKLAYANMVNGLVREQSIEFSEIPRIVDGSCGKKFGCFIFIVSKAIIAVSVRWSDRHTRPGSPNQ